MDITLLKLTCPDRVGLLGRLCGFVAERGGNLIEVHQYTDPVTKWFFARLAIDRGTLPFTTDELRDAFAPVAAELSAEWTVRSTTRRNRMVIMVSQLGHCLVDLLWRWKSGELPVDLPMVISNHEHFRETVEREGIEFRCIPIDPKDQKKSFDEVEAALAEAQAETVVLARYMQILPESICANYAGRIINIHHSFLPSFVGANPYQRAYERGVKLIGATCHYVTADLDEGPIIEQEVVRVEHMHSAEDMLRLGRDCERMALARGVRYHVANRVLIHGSKTIVFRD